MVTKESQNHNKKYFCSLAFYYSSMQNESKSSQSPSEESDSPWYFVFDHGMFISSSFSSLDFLDIHRWNGEEEMCCEIFEEELKRERRKWERKRETLLYENIWGRAEGKTEEQR